MKKCSILLNLLAFTTIAILSTVGQINAQSMVNKTFSKATNAQLRIEIIDGTTAATTINDICCGRYDGAYREAKNNKIKTAYGENSIWARLYLPDLRGIIRLGAIVDKVTLYRVFGDGAISKSVSGDIVSIENRELFGPEIAFLIDKKDASREYYLEIEQPVKTTLAIDFISIDEFSRESRRKDIIHAALIGGIFIIVLYNLVVSMLTREIVYFYNAMTIISLLTLDLYMTGIGVLLVWPGYFWLSNYILVFSIGAAVISGSLFIGTYVQVPNSEYQFKWQPLKIVAAATLAVLISLIWIPYWMSQIAMLILSATLLTIVLIQTVSQGRAGNIRAKILSVPVSLCMVPGIALVVLVRVYGVEVGLLAPHLLEITLFLEALFFSLILAYRIRITQSEIASANKTLIDAEIGKAADIVDAIDRDRKRIASDLHDSAGQGLLTIANRLTQLANSSSGGEERRAEISQTADYSRGVVDEIRRISHDLHPATLDYLGWHKAIEGLFDNLRDYEGIATDLTLKINEDALDSNQQVHLYRISQELVSNIAKHANANRCDAIFQLDGDTAMLDISDDGQPHRISGTQGIGYAIIEQRVKGLHGKWQVNNGKDGTKISLRFPVASDGRLKAQ